MRLTRIKLVAILASSAGLVAFEFFRHAVLHRLDHDAAPHLDEHLVSGSVLFVAVVLFSFLIFRPLERLHRQLSTLNEASIAVTSELSSRAVLAHIARLALSVGGVPYASVETTTPHAHASAGDVPTGGKAMEVPIVLKGETVGRLTLVSEQGKKIAGNREALQIFATQAGIALENARLFEQIQELVAVRERSRIGMELHDGVIQHLYALALTLEETSGVAIDDPSQAVAEMGRMNERVRAIVDEIRAYVYDLKEGDASINIAEALEHLVSEFPTGPTRISMEVEEGVVFPGAGAGDVIQIVREAVSNALRHSGAQRISITARSMGEVFSVEIVDDGSGFLRSDRTEGLGLGDMQQRAVRRGGDLHVDSELGRGTAVRLRIPLTDAAEVRR